MSVKNFWYYKYKKMGFCSAICELFAYTVEYKSGWYKENRPEKLPVFLRKEGAKAPKRFNTKPFNTARKEQKTLVELLGRKLPKLELSKPLEYIFKNDFWIFKLSRYGLPLTPCQLIAGYIAKETYLMPPDVRGVWLRTNWNDEKIREHAALVQKLRLAMTEKPA